MDIDDDDDPTIFHTPPPQHCVSPSSQTIGIKNDKLWRKIDKKRPSEEAKLHDDSDLSSSKDGLNMLGFTGPTIKK